MKKKKKIYPALNNIDQEIASYEQERRVSNENKKSLYRDYSKSMLNSNVGDPFSPTNQSNIGSDGKSWYEDTFDFIKNIPANAYDFVTEDIPNAMRMLDEKINEGHLATTENRMSDNNDDKRNIKLIEDYVSLLKQYRDLQANSKSFGTDFLFQNKLQELRQQLDQYDEYFKTTGRTNPVVTDLMYNDGKTLSAGEELTGTAAFVDRGKYDINPPSGIWDATKGLLKTVANTFIHLGQWAEYGYTAATDRKGLMEDVVRNVDENTPEGRAVIDKLYDGKNINISDIENRLQTWNMHTERLDNLYNNWYKSDLKRYKEGLTRLAIPFTDKELFIKTSDPEDVPEDWRTQQQIHAGEFWSHPLYTLPEVGSTIGLASGMVGSMVADGLARMVIKELPTVMLAPEAKLLKMAKMYKSPQMIAKATALMEKAATTNTRYQLAKAGVLSADVSAGIWLTKEARKLETAQESAEAQKQRLLRSLDDSNADPNTIYYAIAKKAQSLGIDVSQLNPDDLMGLAIAYDINTGDETFDKAKAESRKGLMKLINANNALAVVDYAQTLPFLSFGERILSDFAKATSQKLGSAGILAPRIAGWKDKGLWKAIKENYKADVASAKYFQNMPEVTAQALRYADEMQSVYDNRVYRFAEKLMKKDHKILGLMANHAAQWAKPTIAKYAHVGFLEGLEEGQQEILQKRYQRGEYDDYLQSYSIFDIPEVFNNIDLSKDVIKAWFGVGSEDIDDIRKASLIGASASLFFPFIGRAATGAIHTHDNHFMNLISQLNTDWAMKKMISDNYREIHDHNHLSMYYDMFRKGGVDNVRLRRALNNLKQTVDEQSTFASPEYIDDDVQLMENAWTAYKDEQFAKNLASQGIKKYSPEYKTAVINYARALTDLWEDNKGILKGTKDKNAFENSVLQKIMSYMDPNLSEEDKTEIINEMPEIKSLVSAFKRLHSVYRSGFEEHLEQDKQNVPVVKQRYKELLMSLTKTPEELLKDKHFYNALEQYFIQTGELTDTNLSPNKAYITRSLQNIIANEDLFDSIVNNAVSTKYAEQEIKLSNLQPLSEEEHVRLLAHQYSLYQQLKRAQAMLLMLQDQEKTQKEVRLLTGRDIKTDKIRGMISGIKELIEVLQKEEKEMFDKNGKLNEMFEDLELSYPNQQEYNKIVDGLMLFTAISNPHRKIASAYMYDKTHGEEKISPEEFLDAIFGETVNVSDPLYNKLIKISNEYKQLLALQEEESNLAKKQGSAEYRDLFVTEKRAANAVVMDEIRQAEQRVRIAHKQYEEDAKETLQQEEHPIIESQREEAENPVETPIEAEPEEKKPLILDPDLEEDSIIETLDNDGEETRKKKAALRRMEEAEQKRREEQKDSEEEQNTQAAQPFIDRMNAATTHEENDKAANDAAQAGIPEKEWISAYHRNESRIEKENKTVEKQDSNEVLLVKIPMYPGLIQRVNINGNIYDIKAEVESVDDDQDKTIVHLTLSNTDVLSYSVMTDALGSGYSYTDDSTAVSGIIGFDIVRSRNGENGVFNSPSEIRLIGRDNNIIGMFVQTQDNPVDDTDTTPPIVTDEEKGAPEVVGEQPTGEITGENDTIIPEITGEDQVVIPDVTGEGADETPEVTGENNTPITINNLGFDDEQGFIDQFGVPLTEKEQQSIQIQDEILTDIDFYKKYSSQFGVPRKNTRDDVQDEGDIGDYLSQTLFYDPNGEKPIDLKINGEQISLKYPLHPGKELAQKLLDHDWLKNCYKYFVVTQAQDAAYKSANNPDSFTVTLIIEDEEANASYAVSYRQLGKYVSKGKVVKDGKEIEEEFNVDHEQELRDFLISVHGKGETTAERIQNYKNALYGVIMEKEFLREATQEIIEGRKQSLEESEIQEARRKAIAWVKNKPSIRRNESEDDFSIRQKQYEAKLSYYIEVARDRISRRNREKISASDIEKQISKLRENRLQIINKYLHHHEENGQTIYEFPKPTETKRTVTADNIVQSNGKFDNQKSDEQPFINNLSHLNNRFGIKSTTEDISKQIKDGEVLIGIGSGDFRSNKSYIISDFRKGVSWTLDIQRGGVAGKVYLIIDTQNGNQVPLMLLEQKFDKQFDTQGGYNSAMQESKLQLCLDVDGSIINNDVLPSAAEVLLYLLTGNITSDQFSGLSKELQKQFADLFVNNGENTILRDSNVEDQVPSYAAKQLQVIQRSNGKNDLIIGMPVYDGDGIETGKYRQTYYKNEDLFMPGNEDLRKQVVKAIAKQMHWNTDRETMGQFFGGNNTRLIVDYLEKYFRNNPSEERYSLYGVPEFTFNKSDLFEVDETGSPIKVKSDVYVASWMIRTGKIYTDVSDNIFKNPWVFTSSNVKDNSSDTIITGENDAIKTETGDVDINKTVEESNKKKKSSTPKKSSLDLFDEEKYNRLPGILKSKKVVKEESIETLPKKILISDPQDAGKKYEDKKTFAQYLKDRLENLAKELNDSGKFDVKITVPDNIEEYVTKGMAFEQMQRRYIDPRNTSKIYPVVSINSDGTMHLQHSNYQRQTGAIQVNGVYQTQKTGGLMDRKQAVKWLNEKIGIPEHDILVTNIMMTSVENGEEVFGVVDAVFDTLREEFAGILRLNPVGGRGLHYHEAWHYVNLLIHDTATQNKLFNAYANSHPEYKGKSRIEIEEALAEEFRMWMELRDTDGFVNNAKGIIKRFFYALSDVLRLSGDKGKYRAVFRKINKGQYKKEKLSDQSIKEFKKFYKNGVYQVYAPGFDRRSLDNIAKVVNNTDDFLSIIDAIGEYIILSVDIRTQDDLKSLCSDNFQSVLEDLEVLNNTDDISEGVKPIINAFLENPEAIRYTVVRKLKDFGIITKKDSISKSREEEETENSETGTEDEPWNIFDRFQFTVSKKQNAAFLAKLFMHTIPLKHWAVQTDGKLVLEDTPNEIIPVIPKIIPYDEVWNRLQDEFKNLNNTWGEKDADGNYDPYSFRWIVRKQADLNDPLFATIDEMLDDIEEDTQLKAQLLTTLNSQKPNISQFELVNAYRIQTELEKQIREGNVDFSAIDQVTLDKDRKEGDAFALADRNKKWELLNDNSLKASRSIPRDWSNRILTYGLIDYKNNGKISKEYYKLLEKKYNAIFSILNEYFGRRVKTQNQKERKIEEVKQMTVELLQQMGVSVDLETLNFYLYSKIGKGNITEDEQAKEIKSMFDKYSTGTFGYILNLIKSNIDNTEFSKVARKKGGSEIKKDLKRSLEIDALYTGTSSNSIITKFALAKFAVHPGSAEYGVRDAKGNMLYPVSQNSFISSKQRLLNTTGGEEARKMLRSPYARNSIILNLAKTFSINQANDDQIKFNVHVGLSGKLEDNGSDYFDITSIEDYIMKMILLDQDPTFGGVEKNNESTHLILPTMADKKTYGDISHRELRTAHEPFFGLLTENQKYEIYSQEYYNQTGDDYIEDLSLNNLMRDRWIMNLTEDQKEWFLRKHIQSNPQFNRYADNTLKIFANYFLDEIEALIQYYSKENIQFLIDNPTKIKKNFHGKIQNFNGKKRLDFSGNGGLFRYFYDSVHTGVYDKDGKELNLNQKLEYLYNLERNLYDGKKSFVRIKGASDIDDVQFMSLSSVSPDAQTLNDLDGFELIRNELENIKNRYFRTIYDNNKAVGLTPTEELLSGINEHLVSLLDDEMTALYTNPNIELARKIGDTIVPVSVPAQLLSRQHQRFKNAGLISGNYTPYSKKSRNDGTDALMLRSLIANHVANTAISIIEFEKVFQGDSSFFKYGYLTDENRNDVTTKVTMDYTLPDGTVVQSEQNVRIISEKETDKIKRLGSLLSPGDELMLSYTEEDYKKYKDLVRGDKFTNIVVSDINAKSRYIDSVLKPTIKRHLFVDYIRSHNFEPIQKYIEEVQEKEGKNNFDLERAINQIYLDSRIEVDGKKTSLFDYLWEQLDDVHKKMIEQRTQQKTNPFGKINVADAQVLIRPQMYRKVRIGLGKWTDEDEEAFWILETDASWMSDPEKAEKVSKLELFPLKMAYYSNDPEEYGKGVYVNTPTLGKQAIFPWFKYHASSQVGMDIYNRMNKKGSELDFISFDSAVKVGAPQYQTSLYKKGVQILGQMSDDFLKESSEYITKSGNVKHRSGDTQPVLIQDLKYLRYQLNTQSHKAHERAIGTQMFKIAFSNIEDDSLYGIHKKGVQPRLGREIRKDIMRNISLLTKIGAFTIEQEFYNKHGNVDREAMRKWARRVIENNDLGATADDIIKNGFVAESLMNRKTFEQAISKLVNKEVVDISTNGGTAVQQSAFGFNSYDGNSVDSWDGKTYHQYNDGKPIQWIADKDAGTMQILLGMNFFKSIVPEEYRSDYKKMRDWLLENNIIGNKSNPYGIGYRIPTQGQSSMFVFQVADVLPEQQGDVIVVPYEFTAQTGSDFDVDKLFLATMSYTNGQYDTIEDDLYNYFVSGKGDVSELCRKYGVYWRTDFKNINLKQSEQSYYKDRADFDHSIDRQKEALNKLFVSYKGAIQNRLLQDYMTILSDTKMFTINRGSIDVISDAIHDSILSWLKPTKTSYQTGMYELTPSFQAMKKLEFSVGKAGISIFALNITNLALTQYSHLAMDLEGNNPYDLKPLDCIRGEDDNYTADWLSAMINACVDVAKDPYIFVLNTNQTTFDTAAFLLRSGKGISTFTFLAQPILKQYAAQASVSGGIYGNNITGWETAEESKRKKDSIIKQNLLVSYMRDMESIRKQFTDEQWSRVSKDIQEAYGEAVLFIKYKYTKDLSSKQKGAIRSKNKNRPPSLSSDKAVFDFEAGKKYILDFSSNDPEKRLASYLYQIKVLKAYIDLEPFVRKMADLVQMSQIDTKKFGNDIVQQLNYEARMRIFKYDSTGWIINTKKERDISRQIPGYALGKYYKTMFLEEKFNAARKYTKELLSTQLLVASDSFEKLFKDIAKELNGVKTYEVPVMEYNKTTKRYEYKFETTKSGKKQIVTRTEETFNPFYNEKSIEAISAAINNIARFNILMNYGIRQQNKKLIGNENSQYETPIDFSFGGNFSQLVRNVSDLLFGNNEQRSLPGRLFDFISDILNNPESEDAEGLVEDGKIINQFLSYLQPYNKTDEIPIDRLLLNDSQFRTNKNKKDILASSWYTLFTHPSEKVRKLANDIALYSYYTTYDTPAINSITDLIPGMFRIKYDDALKSALGRDETKLLEYMSLDYFIKAISEESRGFFSDHITPQGLFIDIICRNYYYNNDIVKSMDETGNGHLSHDDQHQVEWRGVTIRTKEKNHFSGIIATSVSPRGTLSHPIYIKIKKGNETMLYKRIGVINKMAESKKGSKQIMDPLFVYVAVQKAGLHIPSKKIHMFEFYANEFIPSLFRNQNILPEKFTRKNLLDTLMKEIESWNKDKTVKSQKAKYIFTNDEEITSSLFTDSYNAMVYRSKNATMFEDPIVNDGDIFYSAEKKFSPFGHKNYADVIISINKDQGDFNNKTLHIGKSGEFIDAIDNYTAKHNLSGSIQLTFDSDISVVTEDGKSTLKLNKKSVFYPTQQEVDEYIDQLIEMSMKDLVKKNPYLTQSEINEYKEEQKQLAKQFDVERNVAIKKLATAISNMINYISIKHPDVKIKQLRINGMSLDAIAAIAVQKANSENIEYKMSLKIDRSDVGTEGYKDFLNLYKSNITISQEDIYDSYEEDTPQEGVQKLLEQYIPEVEEETAEDLTEEPMDFEFDFNLADLADPDAEVSTDDVATDKSAENQEKQSDPTINKESENTSENKECS